MVHLDDQSDGGARYRLLETVRAYAGELLDESVRAVLADRHAAHYLALAQEAQPLLFAAGSGPWLERAQLRVRIPMFGRADSLNVATSAAILVYEAVRQRMGRAARP